VQQLTAITSLAPIGGEMNPRGDVRSSVTTSCDRATILPEHRFRAQECHCVKSHDSSQQALEDAFVGTVLAQKVARLQRIAVRKILTSWVHQVDMGLRYVVRLPRDLASGGIISLPVYYILNSSNQACEPSQQMVARYLRRMVATPCR
jgi:hypothetical protein